MKLAFSHWLKDDIAKLLDLERKDLSSDSTTKRAQEALEAVRHRLGQNAALEHQLQKEEAALASELATLATVPEEAVRAGEDALARAALRRSEDIAERRSEIEALLIELRAENRDLLRAIEALASATGEGARALSIEQRERLEQIRTQKGDW